MIRHCRPNFPAPLSSFQVLPVQYPVGEEKEDAKRVVCDKPGNLCFKHSSRLLALLARIRFLSPSAFSSVTFSHFVTWWVMLAFLLHTYIAASTRSAISSASCSELKLRKSRRWSGEN